MNLPYKAIRMGKDAIVLDYDKGLIHHYHNCFDQSWSIWSSYSTEEEFEKALPNWVINLQNDEEWPLVAYFWIDLAASLS